MRRHIILLLAAMFTTLAMAQTKSEGRCSGKSIKWTFDGITLSFENVDPTGLPASIEDFDMTHHKAPWVKHGAKKVVIGTNIERIGSCAFASLTSLQEVVVQGSWLRAIGWGTFYGCTALRTINLPQSLFEIGAVAFAGCTSLKSVTLPANCHVDELAYANCSNLQVIDCDPSVVLGSNVFACEIQRDGVIRHTLYNGQLLRLPAHINTSNCTDAGIALSAVERRKIAKNPVETTLTGTATSAVDSIFAGSTDRPATYALVIGNENYIHATDVTYALHDARVFYQYCTQTLRLPETNVFFLSNATRQMILDALTDLNSIGQPGNKNLIVYYAGHGMPNIRQENKAYLLPVDVRTDRLQSSIALDSLYSYLGNLGFSRVTVFLDACFSGTNRDLRGVNVGERGGISIAPQDATFGDGRVVVFSASSGNQTAQGYDAQGHGLFTYYLLKRLGESRGATSLGQLADYLQSNVSARSMQLKNRKQQTPTVRTSDNLVDEWRQLGL